MRKLLLLSLVGALLIAAPAISTVVGTKHDLSGNVGTYDIGTAQICVACHTPHAAAPAVPLWNHSLPSPANTVMTHPVIENYAEPDGVIIDLKDSGSTGLALMSGVDGLTIKLRN